MYCLLIIWVYLHFASGFAHTSGSLVITEHGKIRGQYKIWGNGIKYYSFTGIPYAKPPIGLLRFEGPREPDPWNFTRDATREPPVCIQRNYLFSSTPPIEGSEDCLYLNVYTPQVRVRDKLYPVMVFIHWGAFIAGRSTSGYLGPEYFMAKDIVLVTFNYRLGPFGFLSTIDDEAPGNYGLKDQVAVLRWVQRNIENFGGDKNNVLIFGQSAGAGSVHYHLLSPASKGLFHKAISQSGSALAGWALPSNVIQKQVTLMQAKFVGCENFTASTKELICCLRSVPADELMKTQDYFRPFYGNPLGLFGSVIEAETEKNRDPFLTKTPLEYISNGEIKNVPWIIGVVKNEGLLRAPSLIRPQKVREQLNQNFEKLVSDVLLLLSLSAETPHSLYENVTEFYLGGKEFIDVEDQKNVQGFVDLYTDRAFFYPVYQTILLHSQKGHTPIYLYNFEYEGKYSYGNLFSNTGENIDHHWGTCHCDDLLYLFRSPDFFQGGRMRNDILLTKKLVTIWTNFAKYGHLNPSENSVDSNLAWRPLNISMAMENQDVNSRIELLNITGNYRVGATFKISKGFYKERMKFWTDSDIFENQIGLK